MSADKNNDGQFRRKHPRRAFRRRVGILCGGQYHICETGELGEGGMSVISSMQIPDKSELVVSFQIPTGQFVSIRGTVRSCKNEKGRFIHGLSFENIQFSNKRQIRSFVSARSEHDEITF